MRITESQLRTVIREELTNYLNEDKQVLEEGKIHNFIAGILAAVAIGGIAGGKMNDAPTSREVVQSSVTASDTAATNVEQIIQQNEIKFNKEDSSLSIGGEVVGILSPNVIDSIKKLHDIGYVANTGANTRKLSEIKQLKKQIEEDKSYIEVAKKIQNLKGVQTDQQRKAESIFAIIIGAAIVGLLLTTVDSIYSDPISSPRRSPTPIKRR
jgi:hypothetical protein